MFDEKPFVSDLTCGPCETALIEDHETRAYAQMAVDFLLGLPREAYLKYISERPNFSSLRHAFDDMNIDQANAAVECSERHRCGGCIIRFSNITKVYDEPEPNN